ncbi:MAG: sigma-70 family RNA polymerase sigma factor [Sphingobacteriaceae bacterium]|nr:sigma-70 family RNA polymerase sigma factor [Sphingobacteriaceae bacterium]
MWLFKKASYQSDEEIIKAYKDTGNTALIGELFEKHVKTVYGACLFFFKEKAEAQDAVMQIFEKLIVELRKKDVLNFKGWLSFVVRNHCINIIRQNKTRFSYREGHFGFELEAPDEQEENYLASLSNEELIEKLPMFLNKLNAKQKDCIELFFLKNKSYHDIASSTGYSLNEVKSYIQNGKRNLKQIILDHKDTNAA